MRTKNTKIFENSISSNKKKKLRKNQKVTNNDNDELELTRYLTNKQILKNLKLIPLFVRVSIKVIGLCLIEVDIVKIVNL